MRIAENFARNDTGLLPPGRYDNLYRTTMSDDLLAVAAVGDTVYISFLVDSKDKIPALRVYDTNSSKSLSVGLLHTPMIPPGKAWWTLTSEFRDGGGRNEWFLDIWDQTTGAGNGYDFELSNVIVSLTPSGIWIPAHADLTPEQIETLPPYGEYKEIKSF